MQSLPPTWAQKVLLALLSTTACLQASANPMLVPQAHLAPPENGPLPESMEQLGILQAHQYSPDAGQAAPSTISYGHCYYFTDPIGSHLGSDGGYYSYLKFNSYNYRRPFRLCKDHDDCSESGSLQHRGSFYLEDYLGSIVAKGKNIVAADAPGHMYPGFPAHTNYLHFKAYSDCDITSSSDCYVRLKLTGQPANLNGLEVDAAGYLNNSPKEQTTVAVRFNRIECPDSRDRGDSEL